MPVLDARFEQHGLLYEADGRTTLSTPLRGCPMLGADDSLCVRILPRRSSCRDNLVDAHVLDSILEVMAVDRIAVTNQKPWLSLPEMLSEPIFACRFAERHESEP